jgi:hypothetical protein
VATTIRGRQLGEGKISLNRTRQFYQRHNSRSATLSRNP